MVGPCPGQGPLLSGHTLSLQGRKQDGLLIPVMAGIDVIFETSHQPVHDFRFDTHTPGGLLGIRVQNLQNLQDRFMFNAEQVGYLGHP